MKTMGKRPEIMASLLAHSPRKKAKNIDVKLNRTIDTKAMMESTMERTTRTLSFDAYTKRKDLIFGEPGAHEVRFASIV